MANNDLTQGSLYKHIKNIAIPASIGYLFNTLYNVVDTFYAGKISTEALAGMTISFPIFFIIIALSSGIGVGTTALNAIALGKKDVKKFHQLSYNAIFLGILVSIIIIISASTITNFLFELSGSSGDSMHQGVIYTNTIFYGSLFFIMNFILNGILNAQGDTKTYRNFLIFGFFLNLILDPLLIFGWFGLPKLETVGVALATVIVQFLGTLFLLRAVFKSQVFEFKLFKSSKISKTILKDILKQGIPSSLNMATIAIGVFVINYFILHYGNPSIIAGYGAAVRIEQLVLLPALGLNIAVLTITGQSYGARDKNRIIAIHKLATKISSLMMIAGIFIIYPLASILIRLFNNDPSVIEAGKVYLRIEVFAFVTYVILNISTSSLQGIKKPTFAVFIGLYRQIILPIIIFYILTNVFDMGVKGIWWGIVIVNWSAVFITQIYYKHQINNINFDN